MDIQGTIENIHAYLSGQLTVDQVEAFEEWRNDSLHNAKLVEEVETAWQNALLYESPRFDSTSAIAKMPFGKKRNPIHDIKVKSPSRLLSRWAAAAAVILVVGAWGVYQLSQTPLREIDGRYAQFIHLEDGTEVYLEKDGLVAFPESFTSAERLVMLDGEAYFEVAKENERQFVIETDFARVMVLGTEFSVDEDDDAQTVEVYVTEGKVRLQPSGSNVFVDIKAGESALYDHKSGKLQRFKNADMNHIAWHTKRLQFVKTPMPKVIRDIEATFNVSIDYQNSGIDECTFSSLYDNVEVTKILEDMSLVFGFRITSPKMDHYVLSGGNCNRTKGY
jgi:transmembrane sensor